MPRAAAVHWRRPGAQRHHGGRGPRPGAVPRHAEAAHLGPRPVPVCPFLSCSCLLTEQCCDLVRCCHSSVVDHQEHSPGPAPDLWSSGVGDNGAEALALLRATPQLRRLTLDLQNNDIGPAGAQALALLGESPTLQAGVVRGAMAEGEVLRWGHILCHASGPVCLRCRRQPWPSTSAGTNSKTTGSGRWQPSALPPRCVACPWTCTTTPSLGTPCRRSPRSTPPARYRR